VQYATIRMDRVTRLLPRKAANSSFGLFLSTDYAKRRLVRAPGVRPRAAQQIRRRRHAGRIRNRADAHIVAMR